MGALFFAIVFALLGIGLVYEIITDSKKDKPGCGCLLSILIVFAIAAWFMYMALTSLHIINKPEPPSTKQYNQAQVTHTEYEPEYIGNKHSYKFHYDWCGSVDDMYEGNKVYGKTRDYLISHGYVPCKRCDP